MRFIIIFLSLLLLFAATASARIIEVNPTPSAFTSTITDIFLQGRAGEVMETLVEMICL